jgi:hypothetical protein
MYRSSESITVKTEIMAKMPMVIPKSERNVRNLFALSELNANEKLSNIKRTNNICHNHLIVKIPIVPAICLWICVNPVHLTFRIYLLVLIFLKDYSSRFETEQKLSIFLFQINFCCITGCNLNFLSLQTNWKKEING